MSKYHREVSSTSIDVYDVLVAWDVRNPAIQHAIKKLLQPGNRGHKDTIQDLCEAIESIERGIVIERNSSSKVDDGWITWEGCSEPDECPAEGDETIVQYRMRFGGQSKGKVVALRWDHRNADNDIIAYRIVKEKEE